MSKQEKYQVYARGNHIHVIPIPESRFEKYAAKADHLKHQEQILAALMGETLFLVGATIAFTLSLLYNTHPTFINSSFTSLIFTVITIAVTVGLLTVNVCTEDKVYNYKKKFLSYQAKSPNIEFNALELQKYVNNDNFRSEFLEFMHLAPYLDDKDALELLDIQSERYDEYHKNYLERMQIEKETQQFLEQNSPQRITAYARLQEIKDIHQSLKELP